MAINPQALYPGKIVPSSAEYPYGAARNITVPGDGTGTPYDAAIVNDIFGFQQSLLSAAGLTPSGIPEKVGASQYLSALKKAIGRTFDTLAQAVAATDLNVGETIAIRGRLAVGDAGANAYAVVAAGTGVVDGGLYINGAVHQLRGLFPEGPRVEQFGAVANGIVDDAAAFSASRVLNEPIELQPGATYALGSRIAASAHRQGFFCRAGVADVLLLTGAGKFDRSTYDGSRFDSNAIGFYSLGFDDYVLRGVRISLQGGSGVRTVGAVGVRNGARASVSVEVTGFTETQNGIVTVDSLRDSSIVVHGHDCGTSDDTLATMQLTVCDIDNNPIGAVPTTNTDVVAFGKNILLSGPALVKYGPQTDGVNVSNSGGLNFGLRVVSKFTSIGEPFDCFGCHVMAYVEADDVRASGAVKLIHGARFNDVKLVCGSTDGPAVVFGGSNIASQTVAFNKVSVVCSNVGGVAGASGRKAAVLFDGPTATYKPEYNTVQVVARNGGSMDYVVDFEAGDNNTVDYTFDTVQTKFPSRVQSTAGNKNRAVNRAKMQGGYKIGRYYGGGVADLASTTPVALSANTLYALPFTVTEEDTFTQAHFYVSTAAGGTARLGIYTWSRDGSPATLVHDIGTVSVSTTGLKDVSINGGSGVTLSAGPYVLALVADVGFSVYSTPSTSARNVDFVGAADFGAAPAARMTAAFAFAALPSSFPAVSYDSAAIPNMAMRANG